MSAYSNTLEDALMTALCRGKEEEALQLLRQGAPPDCTDKYGCYPLLKASEKGCTEVVTVLLNRGINVDVADKYGATAFLRVCRAGYLDIVKQLHNRGCSVTVVDQCGNTAIHYAASGGHTELMKYLTKRGLNPHAMNKEQRSPLHLACLYGHVDAARYLVDKHRADAAAQDKDGNTPLHLAVRNPLLIDHAELFSMLCDHGADVNATNKYGRTALHIASQENLVEVVNYLIQFGATVDMRDKNETSAVFAAAVKGNVEVISQLHTAGANINCKDNTGQTPLHASCTEGHLTQTQKLVELKANQGAQDKEGNIPLQKACQYGHYAVAKFLIDTGQSDLLSKDRNGQTPMHKACKGKDTKERCDLLRYLIKAGANVNHQSRFARCPLHCTCQEGNPDAAAILLQNNAKVGLKDKDGRTPLHYAAFGGFSRFPSYSKLIALLLDYEADPNEVDEKGITAVHIAAKVGNKAALKLLLDCNGNPDSICKEGRTAVHYAVLGDPPKVEPIVDVLQFLLDRNSTLSVQDKSGNSPLHYASMSGNADMVNLLLHRRADIFCVNNAHKTPEDLAQHVGVKNILVAAKQQQVHSKEGTVPLPSIKLFLTGHIKAGKTALRKHMGKTKCNPNPCLHARIEESKDRTAGIEIEYLTHESFGTVVAHDLAGHSEYTTSHSVVIDCADTSLFAIVLDITKELSKLCKEANYWAAFIKAGRYTSSRPKVMLVGTHLDEAQAKGMSQSQVSRIYDCIFTELKTNYREFFCIVEGRHIVNCLDQDSEQMDELRTTIGRCCKEIKENHPEVPSICFELLGLLKMASEECGKPAVTVNKALFFIRLRNHRLATMEEESPGTIMGLLEYLSVMGMILLLKSAGWVVIEKEKLLEDIFGVLFAPDGFYSTGRPGTDHGIISLLTLEGLFGSTFGSSIVVDILSELMLGETLEDKNAIQVPALLRVKMQEDYWRVDCKYTVYTGWRLQCLDERDIFSPSLFPKLQVSLLKEKQGRITLWTQGLMFTKNKVQVMISMDEIKKRIDILVRGEEGSEKECYEDRVLERSRIKLEISASSSGTRYNEKIIRPDDVKAGKTDMVAYDYHYLLEQEQRGNVTVAADGVNTDSVRELLYCNHYPLLENESMETEDAGAALPTGSEQYEVAKRIKNSWYQVGLYLGLKSEWLDGIEVETEHIISKEMAAFRMLQKAIESDSLRTTQDLFKALRLSSQKSALQYLLNTCQHVPKKRRLSDCVVP